MKLLYDENLSPRLVARLADLFPGSAHVHDLHLGSAEDEKVWERALADGYTIVSKDSDYFDLGRFRGHPPRSSGCKWETVAPARFTTVCVSIRRRFWISGPTPPRRCSCFPERFSDL